MNDARNDGGRSRDGRSPGHPRRDGIGHNGTQERRSQSGQRRSLTHVGGKVSVFGDADLTQAFVYALEVASATQVQDSSLLRPHVHDFHVYPARMHPETAARLIYALAGPGDVVMDPFCGSGTVPVEAILRGHNTIAADLNPLAVRLTLAKAGTGFNPDDLLAAAIRVRAVADERRTKRRGYAADYGPEDRAAFAPHVLAELDGLRVGIYSEPSSPVRDALDLILSSLLTKLSVRRADTSEEQTDKRIAAGYPAKMFQRRAESFVDGLHIFHRQLPQPKPRLLTFISDVRDLKGVRAGEAQVVVTSPPYAATYDYVEHHDMRMRWLGLSTDSMHKGEIGARRVYSQLNPSEARAAWQGELAGMLRSLARVTSPGARVALLMADSAVGDTPMRADEAIAFSLAGTPFTLTAGASQERPHFHGPTQGAFRNAPRREHVLLLSRG